MPLRRVFGVEGRKACPRNEEIKHFEVLGCVAGYKGFFTIVLLINSKLFKQRSKDKKETKENPASKGHSAKI